MKINSALEDALLCIGIPAAKGEYTKGTTISVQTDAGVSLPVWSTPRAFWPDGSVKWFWLHTRTPAGENTIEICKANSPAVDSTTRGALTLALSPEGKGNATQATVKRDGFSFSGKGDCFEIVSGANKITCRDSRDLFEPDLPCDIADGHFEVVEDSPIAPLIRFTHPVKNGLRKEHLFRLDPLLKIVYWSRRISVMDDGDFSIKSMKADFILESGSWQITDDNNASSLVTPRPHYIQVDGGQETEGHANAMLHSENACVLLDKGWQRAPFGIDVTNEQATLWLYPEHVEPLPVKSGTSFRHEVVIALGDHATKKATHTVDWAWDSQTVCDTGCFGPLIPRNDFIKRVFPGFDEAFEVAINQCRPTKLDAKKGDQIGPPGDLADETTHDPEFFGLEHYGDWPMLIGSYGGSRRMYCDNEYDTAYALFQQFARTGRPEILALARHSAMHMVDVDFFQNKGDMIYHGYGDQADDHRTHRSPSGDLGHYWTDGFWMLHFITGDPFAKENALALTERLVKTFNGDANDTIRRHWTDCERAVGWPMVALCGTAEVSHDPAILDCLERMSRFIATYMTDPDSEFDEITEIDGHEVQWWRTAAQDGCKPFMLGVVMEGLERYHQLNNSQPAADALVSIATFLRDTVWDPLAGSFTYELNAYKRKHRETYPHSINLLICRGLAYAYELTGDTSFMTLCKDAAYGGLWTVFQTGGGKEIGLVGRTSGATAAYLAKWWKQERQNFSDQQPLSKGIPFCFTGSPKDLLDSASLEMLRGTPEFIDDTMVCRGESFAIAKITKPWNTDSGEVVIEYSPDDTVKPNPGGNPHAGWAIFHLCDERFTASAVSVFHYFQRLHIRFYDQERKLIEVLETDIAGWPAGEKREIKFTWNEDRATLWIDGKEADTRPMQRKLSGAFQKLYLGCKPGNWKGKGYLHHITLETGSNR